MIGIHFEKDRTVDLIDRLANGKDILAMNRRWTVHNMLGLAGACFFVASTHGPIMLPGKDYNNLHPEKKELASENWLGSLHAAIEFYGHLSRLVCNGEFDQQSFAVIGLPSEALFGVGTINIVPEPATMSLLGLASLALIRRRKKA